MALTPELCRAGRALLTWSQRDLADRARVAVSTIADFERGARSPNANSVNALEDALNEGGVLFEQGRAALASGTSGFNHLVEGRPSQLIGSADLIDWAGRLDSQAGLPTLVSMLVRASAGGDAVLRFPADEGIREPGWDGICESPRNADYVPAGSSRWELSVRKDVQKKADDDFAKRVAEGDPEMLAATTYVVVSLRAWKNKETWLAEHRKLAIFRDVRAIDVHDLVQWLSMHLKVAQWLAVRLGKRPMSGVAPLDEGWRRWALASTPPLSEAVVLAGRDGEAMSVLAWLNGPPSVLHIQAAETDEAIAFLFATTGLLPEANREAYRTHSLVSDSENAAREIAVSMKPQIIVTCRAQVGVAESIARSGHHVYAVHGPETNMNNGITLGDVRRADLANALESMGYQSDSARLLASRAGGSIATLRRILCEATQPPPWATKLSRGALQSAFFAGAWDESAPADRAIIAALAREPFESVSGELASFTIGVGAPLRRSFSKTYAVSVQDLWSVIAPSVSDADVVHVLEIARLVFKKPDPRFGKARLPDFTFASDVPEIETKLLRRGLAESLTVMAVFSEQAKANVPLIEERIQGFVRELLDDADATLWWSLRDVLPLFAEAAPEIFLEAIGASVLRDDAPITTLLQPDGEGFFARDNISDLTTALERLAWFPEYLCDVVVALASLAKEDKKESGQGNRPASTLRQIMLSWAPQTLALPNDRLEAIERIRELYPSVAWRLMLSLLPRYGGDSSSFSSKPRWRLLPLNASPIASGNDARIIFDWLLNDAAHSTVRWSELMENLTGLDDTYRARATQGMLEFISTLECYEDRLAARDVVRKILHRHREFATTAGWAMPESILDPLQRAFEVWSPGSIVDRESWVFSNHPEPPDPVSGHDLQTIERHNAGHRNRVARELLLSKDVDEICSLALRAENPFQLGVALVDVGVEDAFRDLLVRKGAESSEPHLQTLARGMVYAAFPKHGADWVLSIVRSGKAAGWSTTAAVSVLQGMPQEAITFDLASECGDDVERGYWQSTPWTSFIQSSSYAISTCVEQKLRFGIPIEAVALIGQTGTAAFSSTVLIQALTDFGLQLCAGEGNVDSMLSYYCGLIFDQLVANESVDRDILMRLEWTYFGLFQAAGRDSALLENRLACDPQFLIDIVSMVYRADDGEDVSNLKDGTQRMVTARQCYALLQKWAIVPGSSEDGVVDATALSDWVAKAREFALPANRVDIVDQHIGQILSAAKAESNGDWPPLAIREILERTRNKNIETGFQIGTRNRRGVTTRGPLDGGELERDLRARYETLAKRFRSRFPRTANVLKAIAGSYKVDALYMDQLADAVDRA